MFKMKYEEKILYREKKFKGNIIELETYGVELPDGRNATRDVVVHPGASVVIPINNDNEVYMVRQFRTPIEKELLELPAGKLDKNEAPRDCALRELKEETGLSAGKIEHIISIHTTPGFSNEVIHVYLATELEVGSSNADPDEFILCEKHHIDDLVNMVFEHKITDAKTIIGLLSAVKIIKDKN
jgi:ADP-ribose pyrophosphatase